MRFGHVTESDNRNRPESAAIDAFLCPEHGELGAPKVEQAIATAAKHVAEELPKESPAVEEDAAESVVAAFFCRDDESLAIPTTSRFSGATGKQDASLPSTGQDSDVAD